MMGERKGFSGQVQNKIRHYKFLEFHSRNKHLNCDMGLITFWGFFFFFLMGSREGADVVSSVG